MSPGLLARSLHELELFDSLHMGLCLGPRVQIPFPFHCRRLLGLGAPTRAATWGHCGYISLSRNTGAGHLGTGGPPVGAVIPILQTGSKLREP